MAKQTPGARQTEVNVSKDSTNRYGEPEIAVNPKNPDNLVYAVLAMGTTYACQTANGPQCAQATSVYGPQPAGLIQDTPGFSHVSVYTSFDRGKTWRTSTVPAFPPDHPALVERGDPLLTVGPDGTFYLGWDDIRFCDCPTTIIDAGGIAISKSTNGGRTWSKPVLSGTPVDRPFFAVDHSTGTIYEASSGSLGANSKGDPSLPKSAIGAPGSDRWLVASRDGVHWSDPKPFGGFSGIGAFGDAAHGMYATSFKVSDPALCGAAPSCTVFQTTTDQGGNWSRHVAPVPSDASGSPLVAADPTASGHFTIAVADAARANFLVYQTKDAGATWTGPTTVTDDATATHFHPWLAFSPKGVVGLMWQTNVGSGSGPTRTGLPAALPDKVLESLPEQVREAIERHEELPKEVLETLPEQVRNAVEAQAAAPSGYNVWAAVSHDGGATISAPLNVSKADSPAPQTGLPYGIGDDFSFIALSPTHAFVVWADYRPGDRSGYFSAIDLNAFKRS
ncbi:MAG: sialidase family protein [Acidimicrobiia bacterium]